MCVCMYTCNNMHAVMRTQVLASIFAFCLGLGRVSCSQNTCQACFPKLPETLVPASHLTIEALSSQRFANMPSFYILAQVLTLTWQVTCSLSSSQPWFSVLFLWCLSNYGGGFIFISLLILIGTFHIIGRWWEFSPTWGAEQELSTVKVWLMWLK